MSIYNKSDFMDFCEMHHTPEEVVRKYKIYAYDNIIPLAINEPKDLIPYYPYLTSIITSNKNGGHVCLSERSYVDVAEEERLNSEIDSMKKYYRKCKRKKSEYTIEDAVKNFYGEYGMKSAAEYDIELARRVMECGNKADIKDIHIPYFDSCRDKLYELMIENGWDKDIAYIWVYGTKRFIEKNKQKCQKENS